MTKNRKIILILSNIFLNISIIFISYIMKSLPLEKWYLYFAVLSLIQLFVNLYTIIKLEQNFFSLTTLFLIFSYITHLGSLPIFGFGSKVSLPWNPLNTITTDYFREACYFTVLAQSFLTFGMCYMLWKRKNRLIYTQKTITNTDENKELYLARTIGIILIIIGIIPMLYIDINRIILYRTGGYLATFNIGTRGFVSTIGRMTEIGIMMILIGNKRNKKKAIFIIFITLLYQSIIIFTGNRGRPVMFTITIIFIYFNFIKTIKFNDLFKMGIFSYFIGILLTFIGQIRSYSINNINTYIELAKKSFIEFSPFKILAEFCMTIITLGRSIEFIDHTQNIQYGSTYLASLYTILPNIGGMLIPVINKAIYVYNWPDDVKLGLGGSYLGEIYWNFGNFSFFLTFFIGMFLAFISNQIYKFYLEKKYIFLSIYLILFPNLLWWIRDYFMSMVREFVWISIFILILYNILNKKKYKYKN